MTRSSMKELFTPFKNPKREFRSSRKHFKTLSLDESRSPEFNLFFDLEEYSKEEVRELMAETMEQSMSKTRADFGSRVVRPKIKDKDHFEPKANFLRNFVTTPLVVILFYNGLDVPTRQILDLKGAISSKTDADAKVAIQEMAEYSQKWHNGTSRTRSTETSNGLAAIQAQLNNLGREIKKVNEKVCAAQVGYEQYAAIRNQGASIKTLEIKIGQLSKILQERGFRSVPSSTKPNPRDHVMSILNTIEADTNLIHRIGSSQYAISTSQNRASVSVMPLSTYLNLGLGELAHTKLIVELVDRTVEYPKGIVENVLVGIGKFVFPVDFVILDMPKDVKVPLILERPFLSTAHAKIDVLKRKITLRINRPFEWILHRINDLNEPLELRRDQVDDLMPTIEEGEVIDAPMDDLFKFRNDKLDTGIDDYPSCCDYDKKIRIDFLEAIDAYRDEGIDDVIVGETFLREIRIKQDGLKE
nr:hypothetical protein [Tanacetum cinerariifolium]